MLAGFMGDGIGFLIIGICWIAMRHLKESGGSGYGGSGKHHWRTWAMRIVIVFMAVGGASLTLVGVGRLFQKGGHALLNMPGSGFAFVASALAFLFLLAEVCVLWWRSPSSKVAWTAVFLMLVAMLIQGPGPVGRLATQIHQAGTQYSQQLDTWFRS